MDLIGTTELNEKLDRGERFKLVMSLGAWAYRAKRIPGSLFLKANGYERVRCLAGGLEEWESAGYYLEGERHHDGARGTR